MAGYNYDKSGRNPGDIKRRKNQPSGAPRSGQTKAPSSGTGRPQPIMAGTRAEAEKAGNNSTPKKNTPAKKVRFGQGSAKTVNGMANVTADQLKKTGMSLREYMNEWNRTKERPTKSLDSGTPKDKKMKFDPAHRAAMKKAQKEAVPPKPRAGDFKAASAYKRAADRWNLKYGKGSTKATGTPKEGLDYNVKKVQVDPNKRVKQRAKNAAAAILGPISLAAGGAGVTGAARLIGSGDKLKKLAATTTGIGVKTGRRSGQALRNRKGQLSGISKKTQETGRKIRQVAKAGATTGAVAGAAAGAASTAKKEKKDKNLRGRNRRR